MAETELSPCEYGEERKDNDVEDISELDAASTTSERRMIIAEYIEREAILLLYL